MNKTRKSKNTPPGQQALIDKLGIRHTGANSVYLEKSKEAFVLAVELYNKPTINYRVEGFCILFTNAWELLLKAKVYADSGNKTSSIMRKNSRRSNTSITLDTCLNKVFSRRSDPIRKNIEYVADLRNDSTHLYIADPNMDHSGVFQAGVINYTKKLRGWFSDSTDELLPSNMIALLGIDQLQNIKPFNQLGGGLGKSGLSLVKAWHKRYSLLESLGDRAAIVFAHKLVLSNSSELDGTSVTLSKGDDGTLSFVEKDRVKDPDDIYRYKAQEVVGLVNNVLRGSRRINMYHLLAFRFSQGISKDKTKSGLYHIGRVSGVGQYSRVFVDKFVEAANKPGRLETICGKFSQFRKNGGATTASSLQPQLVAS